MAALTTLTLYNRIRSELGDQPWYDVCTEAMDTTETALDVADTTKWAIGSILEFQDDGELCLVTALASATTLTVIRNWNYSVTTTAGTGTSHSINAVIAQNPTITTVDIGRALEGVVSTLWPHVWEVPDTTNTSGPLVSITPVSGTRWYDLGTGVLNIFDIGPVTQTISTSPKKTASYGTRNGYTIHLQHNLFTDIATNRMGLFFPVINNYTYDIKVGLIRPVKTTQTVAGTYDHFDDNTPAADCLTYLTAARLVEMLEVRRTVMSDVGMGDATVQPGSRLRLAAYLQARGLQARNAWSMHCKRVWPKLPKSRFFKDERDAVGRL